MNLLELKGLLSVIQFSLRKGRSVENQLLITYAEMVHVVDSGSVIDTFLSFSKTLLLVIQLFGKIRNVWCSWRPSCLNTRVSVWSPICVKVSGEA